ncbi:hypothetical protein HH308_06505 [Gordonia sp. TBRC 11910]|uniref:Uncharacterized protein n=1 Tax=Gordonia asplenii TaxID=2725283 RepID=A0A848KWM5_9ACTN|nr:hypothetical protein [Gordonia asplenii]NMO00863.1 hypothetical protein [Gordonia asplenii]
MVTTVPDDGDGDATGQSEGVKSLRADRVYFSAPRFDAPQSSRERLDREIETSLAVLREFDALKGASDEDQQVSDSKAILPVGSLHRFGNERPGYLRAGVQRIVQRLKSLRHVRPLGGDSSE